MSADATEKAEADAAMTSRKRYRMAGYTTAASVISKVLSLLVIYLSVPLTISYLGPQRFGVWMTLTSFISFLGFLDFGIGSSLVNEVALYSAKQTRDRLNKLITHALLILSGIGLFLGTLLILAARSADLQYLFNVRGYMTDQELRVAASTLGLLIGASLPIVGLQRVFWGLQRAFVYHLLSGLGYIVSIGLLYLLTRRQAPIPTLLLATYGVQLLSTLPLLLVLKIRGLIGSVDFRSFGPDVRRLLRHGSLFFILSIGGAIAWDSDYIIISKVNGAAEVAVYAVCVRLFQLVEIPLQMINMPLWSAYADALALGSRDFLRKTLVRSFFLTLVAAAAASSFIYLFHEPITRLWIRQAAILPPALIATMAVWITIRAGGNAFAMYLNGIRLIKPQVLIVIGFCLIGLPLKIILVRYHGPVGLVLAGIVSYFLTTVFAYLTVFRHNWIAPLRGNAR